MRFRTADASIRVELPALLQKFSVAGNSSCIDINTAWCDLSNYHCPGRLIFESSGIWKLSCEGDYYSFEFTSPAGPPHPYKIAKFNSSFTCGEIWLHRPCYSRSDNVYPLEYPLDELLIVHLLGKGIGVDVHSCGITDSTGNGFLFVGQSGAGKTTCARLWSQNRSVRVLSDDRNIVRKNGSQFHVYGTPWHGEAELSEAANAQLKGVFLLKQSSQNTLTPIRGATAAARLLGCGFLPFHNREAIDFTLGFLGELAASVPCYEFGFRNDVSAVDFLNDRIR